MVGELSIFSPDIDLWLNDIDSAVELAITSLDGAYRRITGTAFSQLSYASPTTPWS